MACARTLKEALRAGPPLSWGAYGALLRQAGVPDAAAWEEGGWNGQKAAAAGLVRIVEVTSADFASGTLTLFAPAVLRLRSPRSDGVVTVYPNPDNACQPTAAQRAPGGRFASAEFSLGFFAGLRVTSRDARWGAVVDLNRCTMQQHPAFALQQPVYAHIELGSAPFVGGQGPVVGGFPAAFKHAASVCVARGTLGLSSHHGVHGNAADGVVVARVTVRAAEVAGLHLNGSKHVELHQVHVDGRSPLVFHPQTLALFPGAARAEAVLAAAKAAAAQNPAGDTAQAARARVALGETLQGLRAALQDVLHRATVDAAPRVGKPAPEGSSAWQLSRELLPPQGAGALPGGSARYGVVAHPLGVAVNDFTAEGGVHPAQTEPTPGANSRCQMQAACAVSQRAGSSGCGAALTRCPMGGAVSGSVAQSTQCSMWLMSGVHVSNVHVAPVEVCAASMGGQPLNGFFGAVLDAAAQVGSPHCEWVNLVLLTAATAAAAPAAVRSGGAVMDALGTTRVPAAVSDMVHQVLIGREAGALHLAEALRAVPKLAVNRGADLQFHVAKGAVGMRLEGAVGMAVEHCSVEGVWNHGAAGHSQGLTPREGAVVAYTNGTDGGHPAQSSMVGYMGACSKGVYMGACFASNLHDVTVRGVKTHVGEAAGVALDNRCRAVTGWGVTALDVACGDPARGFVRGALQLPTGHVTRCGSTGLAITDGTTAVHLRSVSTAGVRSGGAGHCAADVALRGTHGVRVDTVGADFDGVAAGGTAEQEEVHVARV